MSRDQMVDEAVRRVGVWRLACSRIPVRFKKLGISEVILPDWCLRRVRAEFRRIAEEQAG